MRNQHSFYPYLFVLFLIASFFISGCSTLNSAPEVIEIIPSAVANTATPAPTATPGLLEEVVTEISASTGVDRVSFLGLSGEDWINLGISLFLVLLGYIAGVILTKFVAHLFTQRISIELDEPFLKGMGSSLGWLVVVFTLQFATTRLAFLSPRLKTILGDIYFVFGMLFALRIIWKLINYAEHWYRQKLTLMNGGEEFSSLITIIRRVLLIFIGLIAFSLLLSRFGLNTNSLTITLGIIGLALSLAAQDTISDAIGGFIILADRPFRVGDAIEIEKISDWGDVIKIGLRTTQIHTADNRVVIIPNSIIGKNLVINYTYPDPRYRLETRIHMVYDTDIKAARELITETIRGVDGVLPEEPVDVLCHEMGESALVLRVRWWISDYDHTAFVRDRVIEAVKIALEENGFSVAHPVRDLNLQIIPETVAQLSQALGNSIDPEERANE